MPKAKHGIITIMTVILILLGNTEKMYGTENIQDIPVVIPDPPNTQCTDCPDPQFTDKNFVVHAKAAFNTKFPFDAIGGISTANEGVCTNTGECKLRETMNEFLRLIKLPVWITFLIGAIKAI